MAGPVLLLALLLPVCLPITPALAQVTSAQATAVPPAQPPAAPASETPLSPAQAALFDSPHLANVPAPATLHYLFARTGPGAFEDQALLSVREKMPDGSGLVAAAFLTGARRLPAPVQARFSGNPMPMLFLERDVREMRAATGLPAIHFRERIREAFASGAEIAEEDATVPGGAVVRARRVTLRPFADDPRLANLLPFRDKTYTFLVADEAPGAVLEVRSDSPPDPASGAPAVTETLRLTELTR